MKPDYYNEYQRQLQMIDKNNKRFSLQATAISIVALIVCVIIALLTK